MSKSTLADLPDVVAGLSRALGVLDRRVALLEVRVVALRRTDCRLVLRVLRDFGVSPFNDGSLAMDPESISGSTGLTDGVLSVALDTLRDAKFAERVDVTGHWRVTDEGVWALGDDRS